MSETKIKNVSKLVAVTGALLLIAGTFIYAMGGVINNITRYVIGTLIILISSVFIYPTGKRSHKISDGQRLRAYILTCAGVYVTVTSVL